MTHAESWSITPTAAHGRKAPTNNCKKYIGQNKSGKSGLCLATQPYIANFLPVLSSVGIDKALLELVLYQTLEGSLQPIYSSENKHKGLSQ